MVVSTLAWPIKSWTVRMSVPFWSNWVAKELHRMAAGSFGNVCLANRVMELALERVFMEVVPGDLAGARVGANLGGG